MDGLVGIKVFSATKSNDRKYLGEVITEWIRSHPRCQVIGTIVTQSSDSKFHCLCITIIFRQRPAPLVARSDQRHRM